MKKSSELKKALGLALVLSAGLGWGHAANLAVVGNGASSGPIITTSAFGDIALGTRVRIGKFVNEATLNTQINSFKTSTLNYNGLISWLSDSANFVDLGTNVTNYGTATQTGTGVSSSAFVYNTTASLTVNGVTANRNVFTGSIANVNWSSSISFSSPVYLWVAYNNEIGIFRDSAWTAPVSDLTALTLNLNTISSAQTGNTEILLGGYQDYASGTDLLVLIPEPSTGSLALLGMALAWTVRRKKNAC
jgi:hypothetical protein